jgi:hypothetical protein
MEIITKILFWVLLVVIFILIIIFCYLFVGKARIPKNITWGVDFSQMQAESLGLNWKETYSAIISDLGSKNIKLHTQWDWIEGEKGEYYFDDTDWQLAQAKNNGVKIIYVLGIKSGRWPECHVPVWLANSSEQQQKEYLLAYIKEVVLRYKDNDAIINWQVENEPLFHFGICPAWYYKDDSFLKEEVALVKSLDPSRKVIVSDSGEDSMWFGAAKIGDIVGTTMYREAWAHITNSLGFYFHYLFSPVYYQRKALLINKIFGKDVICIELQAEPWSSKPFSKVPVEEQLKTMNPEILKQNIDFAKQTGLDKFYFWGVEWWYWMKTKQGSPEIWQEAQKVFQ